MLVRNLRRARLLDGIVLRLCSRRKVANDHGVLCRSCAAFGTWFGGCGGYPTAKLAEGWDGDCQPLYATGIRMHVLGKRGVSELPGDI